MDELCKKKRIEKIRNAIKYNHLYSIRFNNDGSGAEFYYFDPTGDHGCPCTMSSSLPIDETIKIVAGTRFKLHELNAFIISTKQ